MLLLQEVIADQVLLVLDTLFYVLWRGMCAVSNCCIFRLAFTYRQLGFQLI